VTATLLAPTDLAAALAPVERWLVVLDFDGTLSPIVDRPDAARPADGALEAVRAVAERTRVAIVSGRPLDDLRARTGDLPVTWAGGHGAEVVTRDGRLTRMIDPAAVAATLDRAVTAVDALVDRADGWLLERKSTSLAVHHRHVPPSVEATALPQVRAALEARCDDPPGFEVLAGKAVLELRPAGVDKGQALAWLAARAPDLDPLVVGDDVTDEDAFRAAVERGGVGVLVSEIPRPTAASWRLAGSDEVVALLVALTRTDHERTER
jgi:trehalose 6-phosphate phosphatase